MPDVWPGPGFIPPPLHNQLRDKVQAGTFFDVMGEGPAVVLLHGVGLDMAMWAPVAERLAQRFTVIRFDMLGHGGSAKPAGNVGLSDYVKQLADMADYFQLERFALVGFSMGALIARAYAVSSSDRLSKLCLMSGVYDRTEEQRAAVAGRLATAREDGPGEIIEAALGRWFTDDFRTRAPDVLKAVRDRLEQNDRNGFLAAYAVFAEADRAASDRLNQIACPTLVSTGALDSGSTGAMASALAAEIPGAQTEIWDGLAHLAPLEAPDSVAASLENFLDREE